MQRAFPDYTVEAYLMLADKSSKCPTDGLNQKFRIEQDPATGTSKVEAVGITADDLSERILCEVNVDDLVQKVFDDTDLFPTSFEFRVLEWSEVYRNNARIDPVLTKECGACEFHTSPEQEAEGLKSGHQECWTQLLGWKKSDFEVPTIFDIGNLHYMKKDKLIQEKRLKMIDVTEDDIGAKSDGKAGFSSSERQWKQAEKVQGNDMTPWFDVDGYRKETESWVYPLHMIDFETTTVAIPFNKGRRPYEEVAFQFSHHVVNADGTVEHKGQFIHTERGVFPNYDFVRALRDELSNDSGTVFRYAAHENTYLNAIYRQLQEYPADIPDRDELCKFIKSITHSTGKVKPAWSGDRDMIDMLELVKRYYYDPATNGENSIKYVLPAMLNSSAYLQEKYSQPIYGATGGIPSLNYPEGWSWIIKKDGVVTDPYKLLPSLFEGKCEDEMLITNGVDIRGGGAAMIAYARMQFSEMSEYEHEELKKGLLQYCELDTFAMVMLYEGWREMAG